MVDLCLSDWREEIGKMFCQHLLADVFALVYTRIKVIVRLANLTSHDGKLLSSIGRLNW